MKKLAILMVLALELAVGGCGNSAPTNVVNTTTSGNWEAQLVGGNGETSGLNFITAFSVRDSGPLDITGFSFFNQGSCFSTAVNAEKETGSAVLTTSSTGAVTGSMSYAVTSTTAGSVLTLTSTSVNGTSNGTVGTTGTLSNGVVAGNWALTGASGCTGAGTFIMCQGNATCTVP